MLRLPSLILMLLASSPAFTLAVQAATPAGEQFRGGTVEWTRLNTGSKTWSRHAGYDDNVLRLMRAHTSLNITREWKSTRPENLPELCRYPFVYSDDITPLSDAAARNLSEYLRRGGFLLVDACGNSSVNPNPVKFFDVHVSFLRRYFADLRVVELPKEHEVFSIYFDLKNRPPRARPMDGGSWLDRMPTFPLRAVFSGDRMIGIISLNGFQCAWSLQGRGKTTDAIECMEMVTNIYIYAMTR